MTDDSDLLRRYVSENSEAAFTQLVERHLRFVYACALRRVGGDAHSAQDVTQSVFIALARHAKVLQEHKALIGWLYTTTRNASAQLVRSSQRRQARETEAHAMSDLTPSNNTELEWERVRPLLDRALDELPDGDRQAVLLRFLENRSYADIGAALQLAENTARMRVDRGVAKLQRLLIRRGVTSASAALGFALASQQALALPAGLPAKVVGLALTQATGATAALTVTAFMSTTKWISGAASIVAIIAIGLSVSQHARLQDVQQNLASLRADRDTLAARLATAEASLAELPQKTFETAPAPAAPNPGSGELAAPPVSPPPAPTPGLEATKKLIARIGPLRTSTELDVAHIANVRNWAKQDPEGLVRWLSSVGRESRQREHSVEAVLACVTESDSELAFMLANSLEREVPRMNRLSEVVRSWALRDPTAVERAIAASDLSSENRQRLLKNVERAKRLKGERP